MTSQLNCKRCSNPVENYPSTVKTLTDDSGTFSIMTYAWSVDGVDPSPVLCDTCKLLIANTGATPDGHQIGGHLLDHSTAHDHYTPPEEST